MSGCSLHSVVPTPHSWKPKQHVQKNLTCFCTYHTRKAKKTWWGKTAWWKSVILTDCSIYLHLIVSLSTSPGLSNIIGIIVYISANSGDPSQSDNKKSYSYGWSFYFGALSFVLAEMVGVLAVHVFIEKHRQLRTKGRPSLSKPPISRTSSYYRNRYYQNRFRRSSYRSNHSGSFRASIVRDGEASLPNDSKVMAALPTPVTVGSEFMLYTLASPLKDGKIDMTVEDLTAAGVHNNTDILPGNCAANRRTTPVWREKGRGGEEGGERPNTRRTSERVEHDIIRGQALTFGTIIGEGRGKTLRRGWYKAASINMLMKCEEIVKEKTLPQCDVCRLLPLSDQASKTQIYSINKSI